MNSSSFALKKLVFMSLFVGLTIICVRFLSFETTIIRVSLGFIPLSACGMLLGPIPAGIVGVIADVLGMLISSRGGVYFFPFAISEFFYGVTFGLILYKKSPSFLRLTLSLLIQFAVINLILGSLWIYLYNLIIIGTPKTFWLVFGSRIISAAVQFPVQLVVINLMKNYLAPHFGKFKL